MLRASSLGHFLDNCLMPDMTSKKKKKRPPSLNFGKFLMINRDIFLSINKKRTSVNGKNIICLHRPTNLLHGFIFNLITAPCQIVRYPENEVVSKVAMVS